MDSSIRVFVHLARGFGATSWKQRMSQGLIVGLNEALPYGYYRASEYGCIVEHSEDKHELLIEKIVRLAFRSILGFDLIHAWRNFKAMRSADVVWTHTESQHLAISALFRLLPRGARPKLIAQSVWLIDRWPRFSMLRRWLFRTLIKQADVLTFLSPCNLAASKQLFPSVRSELVLFGILAERKIAPTIRAGDGSLRILSLGNDEHRDWELLVDSVRGEKKWTVKIASHKIKPSVIRGVSNVEIVRSKSNDELFALYDWADLIVLAIKPNLHASGITVLEEAAVMGVPIVCSDIGGLRAYFSDREVCFVAPLDELALKQAIAELAADHDKLLDLAQNAQARMGSEGLSSVSYARRHVELSKELVGRDRG